MEIITDIITRNSEHKDTNCNTGKPVYKGHSGKPVYKGHLGKPVYKGHSGGTGKYDLYEQLPFKYRLKLYTLFINGKNEAALYRQ